MEAVANYDFTKTSDDELSFKKGAIIKVLNITDDAHWAKAELDGRDGMVPKNYINMKPHEWYKGHITRQSAEVELLAAGFDGAFLIRESESSPGDFSLSVRFQNAVQHFKVLRDGAGKYFLWVVKFNSLNQLIEYHRTSSVSRSQQIFLKDKQEDSSWYQKAIALYNFQAEEENELSFVKGDILEVLEKPKEDWTECKLGEQRGLVPMPYVKLMFDQ